MSQVLIGWTVKKEGSEGTEAERQRFGSRPKTYADRPCVGLCLVRLDLCDRQNTVPTGRACPCKPGPGVVEPMLVWYGTFNSLQACSSKR